MHVHFGWGDLSGSFRDSGLEYDGSPGGWSRTEDSSDPAGRASWSEPATSHDLIDHVAKPPLLIPI